jgi:hypothetical protein
MMGAEDYLIDYVSPTATLRQPIAESEYFLFSPRSLARLTSHRFEVFTRRCKHKQAASAFTSTTDNHAKKSLSWDAYPTSPTDRSIPYPA